MKCFTFLLLVTLLVFSVQSKGLKEEFTWTRISYATPSQQSGFSASSNRNPQHNSGGGYGGYQNGNRKSSGYLSGSTDSNSNKVAPVSNDYIYENNIPMGANKWGNKLFITVPRRRLGVPSTLNYVWINSTQRHNVPLIPYPNLEINQLNSGRDGPHLVSIYRVAVDACDRLWMVDSGLIELPGNNTQVQPASLVIIDLHTNKIIKKYVFKSGDLGHGSNLANLFIDVSRSACTEAYAYMPDLAAYGLVVYSFSENDAWRISHNYFYLEPHAGEFSIGGHRFQWNDGVFSLGLSDLMSDGFRTVYFHSMAGTHLYSVSTRILRNRQLATRSFHANDFKIVADRGPGSQASASDLHQLSGILFLGLVNQNALGCWNTRKSADLANFDVIFRDDKKFIYPCDVKVSNDDLIVLSNTMPVFLYGRLDYDQINFRVWITKVEDAVSGTTCDSSAFGSSSSYEPSNSFGPSSSYKPPSASGGYSPSNSKPSYGYSRQSY